MLLREENHKKYNEIQRELSYCPTPAKCEYI